MTTIMEVHFPNMILSPNNRSNWRKKSPVRAMTKSHARITALQVPHDLPDEGDIPVEITFFEPDNRGRDVDNMLASIKPSIDGICQAWKINDKRLRPIKLLVGEPDKKNPRVKLVFG